MNDNVLGIDIAKNVFQCCLMDGQGKLVKERRVNRSKLLSTVEKLQPGKIVMEACGSANYWGRLFNSMGYTVELLAPQHVKPYVKGNKTDAGDARAIAEAASRPMIPRVSIKTVEQQDQQSLLRIREGYSDSRTALGNQTRGLLAEYGLIVSQGIDKLRRQLPSLFDHTVNNGLSGQMKGWLSMQYTMLLAFDEKIAYCDKEIARLVRVDERCERLLGIEGVGPITALAVVAQVGNGAAFKNGRHLSAYFGLVPRQHSSGEKQRLQGISKRGDKYIRKLLIHGGRSVLRRVGDKTDARSQWAKRIAAERGYNKAVVALANKNARIMLAMLKSGQSYRQAA